MNISDSTHSGPWTIQSKVNDKANNSDNKSNRGGRDELI